MNRAKVRVIEVVEVGESEHVDHGLDGAGLVGVLAAVESGFWAREAEQGREVPPAAASPYHESG
jgi:hypothetical protein